MFSQDADIIDLLLPAVAQMNAAQIRWMRKSLRILACDNNPVLVPSSEMCFMYYCSLNMHFLLINANLHEGGCDCRFSIIFIDSMLFAFCKNVHEDHSRNPVTNK